MRHSILASYVIGAVIMMFMPFVAGDQDDNGEVTSPIKESDVTRFIPDKLAEEQQWLEVYGVVPLDLKRLKVSEYERMVWQFSQYLEWLLKPQFRPTDKFISKNLILVPASSFKDHDEDVAYLRYSVDGKDYLVTQTEVEDKGRIFIFTEKDSDGIFIDEVPEDAPRLELTERIELPEKECFIFSKQAFGMMRAWGGPAADKWFQTFKNKPPEPKIPFKDVAEALEKLPPDRRLELYERYRGVLPMRQKSMAEEIISEAAKSSYTDEDRRKDDAEYDRKVREAIEVVKKNNDSTDLFIVHYTFLRKTWDKRYEEFSAGNRIRMEAEFHTYGDRLIKIARERAEEGKLE